MSSAVQARPVAYMTAEGAMSNFMSFPPAPLFGPTQYFTGPRGRPGEPISPFFVPNQYASPLDIPGYAPGQYPGSMAIPFTESKPAVQENQEIAVNALLALNKSSSGNTTPQSTTPTTMSAGFVADDHTTDIISALRQHGTFAPGETINACSMDPQYPPDVKPINLLHNMAHLPNVSISDGEQSMTGANGMTDRSPGSKARPKLSRSGNNICQICGKSYARPSTLKTHMRTHSGEKPYRCESCGKAFTQAANLTAHLRTHSGEKPFSCPICQKRFSQSSSVTTHLRTHSGERPYRCDYCGKCFSDTSTLTKHKRIHSGEKPYRCKICNLGFSQSGNLHRHMKTHNN